MKNIDTIEGKCNFTCQTPFGGDTVTCPLCEFFGLEYMIGNKSEKWNELSQKYKNFDKLAHGYEYGIYDFDYCIKCNILFSLGCKREENGCSSSVYNAHLIGKWEYQDTVYCGMPIFDNVEEYFEKVEEIKILEMVCPNNGHQEGGSYPKEKYPEYYQDCSLKT